MGKADMCNIESGDRCRYCDDISGLYIIVPGAVNIFFWYVIYLNATVGDFLQLNILYKPGILGELGIAAWVCAHEIKVQWLPVVADL